MKNSVIEIVADPAKEARRYVENAKDLLRDKGMLDKETRLYQDRKYVRMAGNTLWNGCLIALDAVLHIKNGKGRPSIDKYKAAAAKRDRKLLATILAGYEPMHLLMGYDGTRNKKGCDIGFESANAIIDRCALLYPGEA